MMKNSSVEVITGNYYSKFDSKNPIVRFIMKGYFSHLGQFLKDISPERILELGCGEADITSFICSLKPKAIVNSLDIDLKLVRENQRKIQHASFLTGSGYQLPFGRNIFDLVIILEVLEHLEYPARVLMESLRVGSRYILVSVPREPVWRILNIARGAYLKEMGNTPGHIQHWSRAGIVGLLSQYGKIIRVSSPFPWTMILMKMD